MKESAIASVAANESSPPLSEADLKQSIAQPVANEVTSPPKVSPATIEMVSEEYQATVSGCNLIVASF